MVQNVESEKPKRELVAIFSENIAIGTDPSAFSQGLAAGTHNPGDGAFTFTHPQGDLASDLAASCQ